MNRWSNAMIASRQEIPQCSRIREIVAVTLPYAILIAQQFAKPLPSGPTIGSTRIYFDDGQSSSFGKTNGAAFSDLPPSIASGSVPGVREGAT
jgi:hypothetical protein